jgi:8-oxo-dGTP diphosphatase
MKTVAAGVLVRKGRILVARRKRAGGAPGKWEFPGGTVEPGETPEQGLVRELREELAIKSRAGVLLGSTSGGSGSRRFELMVFDVSSFSGEPRPVDHDEILWVAPSDLASFDLAEADRRVLPSVLAAHPGRTGKGFG